MINLPISNARISQYFGVNRDFYSQYGLRGHNGIDLAAPDSNSFMEWHGTPVIAVAAGNAVWANDHHGYGLYVYVYGNNADWIYAHLSDVAIQQNQHVEQGQIIGFVGYTGNVIPPGARGTHLHWGKRPKPYRLNNGYRGYVDPIS